MNVDRTSRKRNLAAVQRKAVAALVLGLVLTAIPVRAQERSTQNIEAMLKELGQADKADAKTLARDIRRHWARSGSASADLLLKRGRDALRAKKYDVAIEHFTALTDHAPDFAEGWHARASAYYQKDLYGPALDDLARTLALDPNHFDAIQGLGAIFEQLEDFDRAFEAYAQVLAIHPFHETVTEAMDRIEPKVKGPAL